MGRIPTNDLVVLEYSTNTVHFHKISDEIEDIEKAVETLGYKLSDCHYMCGDIQVLKHKGYLVNVDNESN